MLAVLLLASCTKDTTGESAPVKMEDKVASKLVFTSTNAAKGQLLVYFNSDAVANVENSVLRVTRAGGVATVRASPISTPVLDNIGVKSLRRLFRWTTERRTHPCGRSAPNCSCLIFGWDGRR